VELPVTEPLTLQEAKEWLIVGHSQDDVIIRRLITAVRLMCESRTKRQFIACTVLVTANIVEPFYLPRLPVVSVESVTIRNPDTNIYDPVDTDKYYEDGETVVIKEYTAYNRYQVNYTAGYESLPEDLKQAMLHELAYRYENRGNLNVKSGLHETTVQMLTPYMNVRYSI
jgi:uncharacterized phiE125 gp8 family phage protein